MFTRIRKRFTYANVAMTLALVLAMSGGAYAAGKYLITSTKQISPKVLKALQGKSGPAGAPGAQGAVGPQGLQGLQGPQGSAGAKGEKGEKGDPGTPGTPGKDGTTGFTEMLPSKMTETGTWSFGEAPAGGILHVPIAFPIPLSAELDASHIHFIEAGETAPAGCTGGSVGAPTAQPGNLCVYASLLEHATQLQTLFFNPETTSPGSAAAGGGTTGTVMNIKVEPEGLGLGTWAVTAE